MTGVEYERELKEILEANQERLLTIFKRCNVEEMDNYSLIKDFPFMVIRAAGSFGVDLIALRGEVAFPIEVKSTSEDTIRLSNARLKGQAERYIEIAGRAGVMPIYAVRRKKVKGDPWRLFALPNIQSSHIISLTVIPRAEVTPRGHFILRWDSGIPLNIFIKYLHRVLSRLNENIP